MIKNYNDQEKKKISDVPPLLARRVPSVHQQVMSPARSGREEQKKREGIALEIGAGGPPTSYGDANRQ